MIIVSVFQTALAYNSQKGNNFFCHYDFYLFLACISRCSYCKIPNTCSVGRCHGGYAYDVVNNECKGTLAYKPVINNKIQISVAAITILNVMIKTNKILFA